MFTFGAFGAIGSLVYGTILAYAAAFKQDDSEYD